MDTIKMQHRQARLIAHRGLSGLERENTAAAFVAAGEALAEKGVDFITTNILE